MSLSILWQPVRGKTLDAESSMAFDLGLPCEFTSADLSFLEGYAKGNAANRKGVEELIEAIEKHGRVRVWSES